MKSSKICQIQLPFLAIVVHDLFLTDSTLMVLPLPLSSFGLCDITLMCFVSCSLSAVTSFLVISNADSSQDSETQYLAPEQCAEFLGLFISLYTSDVGLQVPGQELFAESCLSGLILLDAPQVLQSPHAQNVMQQLVHKTCSLSCVPFQEKYQDLHLVVSPAAESYAQTFQNSSQNSSHIFLVLQNCIFKAIL